MLLKVTALKYFTILDPHPLEGVGEVTIQQEPGEYKEYDLLPEQIHRLIPLLDRAQAAAMLIYVADGGGGTTTEVFVECLSTDNVGELMCIRADKTAAGWWRVQKSDCTDITKMPARGVLVEKSSPTSGTMQLLGEVAGQFTGLDISKPYFTGPAGTLITPAPVPAVGTLVRVQKFGFPVSDDVLYLLGTNPVMITRRG